MDQFRQGDGTAVRVQVGSEQQVDVVGHDHRNVQRHSALVPVFAGRESQIAGLVWQLDSACSERDKVCPAGGLNVRQVPAGQRFSLD
jgi:hypothetical protein